MSIEVRQLIIKSSVEPSTAENAGDGQAAEAATESKQAPKGPEPCFDPELFKAEVLADCRRMILEILADSRER